jgi:Zn-dependent peptidase ImmA (M78 family)/DNA-binding XRE family transcriptional regulator
MNRIKQLRLAKGLSLDDLAQCMGGVVSKQAISKYERNLSFPSAPVLNQLALALDVKAIELWKEPDISVRLVAYRKGSTLPKKSQASIEALVCRQIEHRLRLQGYCYDNIPFELPVQSIEVNELEQAEEAAEQVRSLWKLGEAPIGDLTSLLESNLVHVLEVDAPKRFDGISAIVEDRHGNFRAGAVATRTGCPGERQRLNIAHELGHIVLKPKKNVDEEKAAFRFGGAFIAPRYFLENQVGSKRTSVELEELLILKRRFGLSIQALLRRLLDLEIISQTHYKWWCIYISKQQWRLREPEELPNEKAQWPKQAALRAFSEGYVTSEQANDLAGEEVVSQVNPGTLRRRAFLNLPIEERRRILEEQASQMKKHYSEDKNWRAIEDGDVIDYDYDESQKR